MWFHIWNCFYFFRLFRSYVDTFLTHLFCFSWFLVLFLFMFSAHLLVRLFTFEIKNSHIWNKSVISSRFWNDGSKKIPVEKKKKCEIYLDVNLESHFIFRWEEMAFEIVHFENIGFKRIPKRHYIKQVWELSDHPSTR